MAEFQAVGVTDGILFIDEIDAAALDAYTALFTNPTPVTLGASWDISTPISPTLYRIFTGRRLSKARRLAWVRWSRQEQKRARAQRRDAQRRAIGITDERSAL